MAKSHRMVTAWVLLGVSLGAGCDTAEPERPSVSLAGEIRLLDADSPPRARALFTLENVGTIDVRYLTCNHVFEARTEADWETLWSALCLVAENDVTLEPGDRRTDTLEGRLAFEDGRDAAGEDLRIGTFIFHQGSPSADFRTTEILAAQPR